MAVRWIVYIMVFLGSALMVFNIISFIRFYARHRGDKDANKENRLLVVPIILLVLFLIGYIAIGVFGKPDLIVAAILFGGSIFVTIMYFLLNAITKQISEKHALEAELKAAEESDRVKTTFLAGMSHEMRTPMNVILGESTLALKNPDLAPETRKQMEKIEQSGQYLLRLINNMLEINQIEAGELSLKNEVFSLHETIRGLGAIYQTLCEEKGLGFQVSVQDGLIDWVVGDDMCLRHVLLAIMSNGLKFTDAPGKLRLTVESEDTEKDPQNIRFIVSDTGVGIDEEFLPNLFDLFAREDDSSTSRFAGTGIGLPAAKKRVELMGGTISVESRKNEGSTFTVVIPLAKVDEELVETLAEAALRVEEEEESLEGCRILVVEDIRENAEIVEDLLDLEGAVAEHAENGQIALEMFKEHPENYYDAVLMDLRMPVVDGLEATRMIRTLDREDAKRIPILALTANAYDSDIQQTVEAGMNGHLVKPIDADDLYVNLRHVIHDNRIAHVQ